MIRLDQPRQTFGFDRGRHYLWGIRVPGRLWNALLDRWEWRTRWRWRWLRLRDRFR